tara:strand:- start:276 stop:731 length:456 start_codon:yes stop_codon:yes gene_type:complete
MTKIAPLRIALFEPQIPPNTGNIARTSAAFRVPLTLIEPLGFKVDDRSVRRAGLDYWPHVQLSIASNFAEFQAELRPEQRLIGCSRRGGSSLSSFTFQRGDVLLFGREDTGYRNRFAKPATASSRSPCLELLMTQAREVFAASIFPWPAPW